LILTKRVLLDKIGWREIKDCGKTFLGCSFDKKKINLYKHIHRNKGGIRIMIKKQQKWIALIVALTFMWLLQVSTMPMVAAGTSEQVGSASAEQGPGYVEAVGHKYVPAPKKSILPYILIGVGVVAVAAVLILVVFKTTYDITGKWTFEWIHNGTSDGSQTFTFTGTKTSGNFTCAETVNNSGTYTVDGKNVVFLITTRTGVQFSGKFTDKDTMTGTWVEGGETWTFTATRIATTASVQPAPVTQSNGAERIITTGPGRAI
jgi:hypothetical protein